MKNYPETWICRIVLIFLTGRNEDEAGSDLGTEGSNDLDLGKIVSITSVKN